VIRVKIHVSNNSLLSKYVRVCNYMVTEPGGLKVYYQTSTEHYAELFPSISHLMIHSLNSNLNDILCILIIPSEKAFPRSVRDTTAKTYPDITKRCEQQQNPITKRRVNIEFLATFCSPS